MSSSTSPTRRCGILREPPAIEPCSPRRTRDGRPLGVVHALAVSPSVVHRLDPELNLAEQHERKRLATELHDHLQQMLVLGKLTIGQGKRFAVGIPACEKMINKLDDVLSDDLRYSRTLVAELSPPVLRDHGLATGLKWLGEYMKKYDLVVTVTVPDEEVRLPEDQVLLLFQTVRELLINSGKHAGTGQADVALEERNGQLHITVHDDGAGFDLATATDSPTGGLSSKFGLFSIRERMLALGGSFDLQSTPGKGTNARLVLPIDSRNETVLRWTQRRTPNREPLPPSTGHELND